MRNKIIRIATMLVGTAIFLNGLLLIIFSNANVGAYLTALFGLCIILPAVFKNITTKIMARHISKFLLVFISFFVVVVLAASVAMFGYGNIETVTYKEDYLLVLGCGLKDDKPSKSLESRLDTALKYCERNTTCKIIVSGGKGNDELVSEAEAMYRYLTEHGIDAERIQKEEKSTSTSENFKYSNRLVNGGFNSYNIAFITNDYHIYRADSLATYQGFGMNYMGASTPWYEIIPSYLREMLAICQMFVFNR